jgi:glyoxylase-like metal-dependent hydrolase (beta-lactamase superfamily II)
MRAVQRLLLAGLLLPLRAADPPLRVQPCADRTWILREDLHATWEAPFLYLLAGRRRALLIDTGDVADPRLMPLAAEVLARLPKDGPARLPLLVVHTHGHLDHRAGDAQFQGLPGVEVVPSDLAHVRRFFGFPAWPEGTAQLDLGDRIVDVLPAPGHHPAELVFYDRATGLLFSGDFLLPGRILVDDLAAYRASADRVAAFAKDRPVTAVLGGHIEMDRAGALFPWASPTHPDERPLPLGKADLLALPAALRRFNGFYTARDGFVVENPIRNLVAGAAALLLVLMILGILAARMVRRWRRRRAGA